MPRVAPATRESAVVGLSRRGWFVHPSAAKDPTLGQAIERAIVDLRYGSVGVNAWAGYAFAFASPPWGARPSSTPADIQSGTGRVHNAPMLEGMEKARTGPRTRSCGG
jgi:hypothetical protein